MIELPLIDLSVPAASRELSAVGAAFLRLMADPTRRRIFLQLMGGEVCNCEMVGQLGLAQNLISHHLRQLRQAGLIRARRDARDQRWVYYTVDRAALAQVHQELGDVFDPARLGEREPDCGPGRPGATVDMALSFLPDASTSIELHQVREIAMDRAHHCLWPLAEAAIAVGAEASTT